VFAAQHRLVNEQLAALAQRIHGFTVETVKPSK
jgi:stress-induced morphogen